ncbi:MAG: mechanosensitive ion channel domain-containing protein, partial [Nitrospinota bacterium]
GIGGHRDVVEDVTLPIARVRTWDDLVVSIPNKEAANKVVVNCTVLEWICLRVPFLRAPPSAGGDDGTGGLGVKMELRGWIKNPYRVQRLPAGWVEEVKERLDEAGIRIPYSHPSLYVEQVLPPGLPGARAPRAG